MLRAEKGNELTAFVGLPYEKDRALFTPLKNYWFPFSAMGFTSDRRSGTPLLAP